MGLSTDHVDSETLELYAIGRITDEAELGPVEEHLLMCPLCQERLREEDAILCEICDVLGLRTWRRVRETADGVVELCVYRVGAREHVARVTGADVDSGHRFRSAEEAQRWCESTFAAMFPSCGCGA